MPGGGPWQSSRRTGEPGPRDRPTTGSTQIYDSSSLGYAGPGFGFSSMPDQYALKAFERLELGAGRRAPVMAEIDLASSHGPWAPLPSMLDWDSMGDGSVFDRIHGQAESAAALWSHRDRVPAAYMTSIAYSLTALISFVERYGDDHLVLILLGDHQPATIVSGFGGNRDVPDHRDRPRPEGDRTDLRVGLADRSAARPPCAGLADGRLSGPLPRRLQRPRRGGAPPGGGPGRDEARPGAEVRPDRRALLDHALRPARLAAYAPGEYVGQESFMRASEILALASRAGIAPGISVLDLCCGVAGPGCLIARELGCTYLGVDVSPSAIRIARQRAGRNCRFEVSRIPPVPAGPFDVVLLLETMLAFPDKLTLLRAVSSALAPGGRFAFTARGGAPPHRGGASAHAGRPHRLAHPRDGAALPPDAAPGCRSRGRGSSPGRTRPPSTPWCRPSPLERSRSGSTSARRHWVTCRPRTGCGATGSGRDECGSSPSSPRTGRWWPR